MAQHKAEGEQFLAKIDTAAGVYKLSSGLRFSVLKRATGPSSKSPTLNDSCSVHYHGTLPNGTVFDSTVTRGKPISFAPSQVIAGWKEALQYMGEGEKWRVYLPHTIAYGANGAGGVIPPYAALTFTIELLKVEKGGKSVAEGHSALEAALGQKYDDLQVVS